MAIEIVDLPSYKMVIFHSYVSLPEGMVGMIWCTWEFHGIFLTILRDYNWYIMGKSSIIGDITGPMEYTMV
jgi:hypothetical protein